MMAREKAPGKKVYQVNMQLFPLSLEAGAGGHQTVEEKKRPESASTGNKDI